VEEDEKEEFIRFKFHKDLSTIKTTNCIIVSRNILDRCLDQMSKDKEIFYIILYQYNACLLKRIVNHFKAIRVFEVILLIRFYRSKYSYQEGIRGFMLDELKIINPSCNTEFVPSPFNYQRPLKQRLVSDTILLAYFQIFLNQFSFLRSLTLFDFSTFGYWRTGDPGLHKLHKVHKLLQLLKLLKLLKLHVHHVCGSTIRCRIAKLLTSLLRELSLVKNLVLEEVFFNHPLYIEFPQLNQLSRARRVRLWTTRRDPRTRKV